MVDRIERIQALYRAAEQQSRNGETSLGMRTGGDGAPQDTLTLRGTGGRPIGRVRSTKCWKA